MTVYKPPHPPGEDKHRLLFWGEAMKEKRIRLEHILGGVGRLTHSSKERISQAYSVVREKLSGVQVQLNRSSPTNEGESFIPLSPVALLGGVAYLVLNAPERCLPVIETCNNLESVDIYSYFTAMAIAAFSLLDCSGDSGMIKKPGVMGLSVKKYAQRSNELARVKSNYSSLVDKLAKQGIPEGLIDQHTELWEFMRTLKENDVVSQNRTFNVQDKDGQRWLLKINTNKTRARIEAAANYYLSPHFTFIVPGKSPEPVEANELYLTFQKDVSGELAIEQPLEYWIGAYALFHREAGTLLCTAGVSLADVSFRSADEQVERYLQGRHNNDFRLDTIRLRESIDYLQGIKRKTAIHGDGKPGNRLGKYLVDLELTGWGHPAIDLALLFAHYGIPQEEWGHHLIGYLMIKGVENSLTEELGELESGMKHAAYYQSAKEIIGSSLREIRTDTIRDNQQLACYARALAA